MPGPEFEDENRNEWIDDGNAHLLNEGPEDLIELADLAAVEENVLDDHVCGDGVSPHVMRGNEEALWTMLAEEIIAQEAKQDGREIGKIETADALDDVGRIGILLAAQEWEKEYESTENEEEADGSAASHEKCERRPIEKLNDVPPEFHLRVTWPCCAGKGEQREVSESNRDGGEATQGIQLVKVASAEGSFAGARHDAELLGEAECDSRDFAKNITLE